MTRRDRLRSNPETLGVLRLYKRKQITVPSRKNAAARCLSAARPPGAKNTGTIRRRNHPGNLGNPRSSPAFPLTDLSLDDLVLEFLCELSPKVVMISWLFARDRAASNTVAIHGESRDESASSASGLRAITEQRVLIVARLRKTRASRVRAYSSMITNGG